jgi:hypothetical protein
MDSEIVVRGTGQVRVLPDRAVVRVVVDGEGSTRDEAYAEAAPLAGRVDEVVDAHRPGVERATTAALAVQPKTRWRRGETVRTGWRASRASVLDVTDLAVLGDLFAELAAAGGAVEGPSWQVDPANPAHAEVRRLAAADARQRAEAYAAALGLRVGGVAWVAEPGLRPGTPGNHAGPVARFAVAASAEPTDADVIDVTPDEIVLDAAVEVGFTYLARAAAS